MSSTTATRGRVARWGIVGAAGACALGLLVPAGGALAQTSATSAPPAGAVVVGTASAACPRPAFATIQPALDATPAGGTVYVCAGTYTGTATISKTVRLLGAQYGRDARTGRTAAATESTITATGAGITVAGTVAGVTVDGFTFSGSGGDGIDSLGRGSGFSIVNNVFTGNQNGMNVNAAGPAASTISRNRFADNNRGTIGQAGTGVLFTSGPANNVSVVDNAFSGHGSAAVNSIGDPTNRSTGIVVRGNRSTDDSSFAVVNNANGARIEGNQATKSAAAVDGTIIYIVGNTDRLTVRGNMLSGDVGTGISANGAFGSAESTNLLIEGNVVRGRTTGILVNGNHRSVTIRGNSVQDSTRSATLPGRGIRLTGGSSGLLVTGNSVSGSSDVDCVDESVGTRTAGTADTWTGNAGRTASPVGLCSPGRAPATIPTTTAAATR